ncbi:hypothetical protein KBD71_00835 [Candidatus Woesebacteria bacterium]|nr:hypothetical protein [Candidatus Woesebacteria bacterium]
MVEIPNFLQGKSGLIVNSTVEAYPLALYLSSLLDGQSQFEDKVPPMLTHYLIRNHLDFAVLHHIRVADRNTILAAIRNDFPIIYIPTLLRGGTDTVALYAELSKAGAVEISRGFTSETVITALIMNFEKHFSARE